MNIVIKSGKIDNLDNYTIINLSDYQRNDRKRNIVVYIDNVNLGLIWNKLKYMLSELIYRKYKTMEYDNILLITSQPTITKITSNIGTIFTDISKITDYYNQSNNDIINYLSEYNLDDIIIVSSNKVNNLIPYHVTYIDINQTNNTKYFVNTTYINDNVWKNNLLQYISSIKNNKYKMVIKLEEGEIIHNDNRAYLLNVNIYNINIYVDEVKMEISQIIYKYNEYDLFDLLRDNMNKIELLSIREIIKHEFKKGLDKEYRLRLNYLMMLTNESINNIIQEDNGYDSTINNIKLRNRINRKIMENKQKKKSEIIFPIIIPNDTNDLTESKRLFNSPVSLTDWYEELCENNCMGLMIKTNTNHVSKMGYIDGNVVNVTMSCIPINQFIDKISQVINKNVDINHKMIIEGRGIGECNSIIPLYIHSSHWYISKKYIPQVFALCNGGHSSNIVDKHINMVFITLIEMIRKSYFDNDMFSHQWIYFLISVYRTCNQIAFEKKYHKGLKYILKNKKANNTKNILGQIIAIKPNMSNINQLLCEITIDYIKKNNITYHDNYNSAIKHINDNNKYIFEIIYSFINMYKLFKELIGKKNGLLNFINEIDNNYGVINEHDRDFLYNKIKAKKMNDECTIDILCESFENEHFKREILKIYMNNE